MGIFDQINHIALVLGTIAAPLLWRALPIIVCMVFVIPFLGINGLGRLFGFVILGIAPVVLLFSAFGLPTTTGWWIAPLWIMGIWVKCVADTIRESQVNRQNRNESDRRSEAIRIVQRLRKAK